MPQTIEFGDTGAVLDLGLPGGVLHTTGAVKTVLNLAFSQPRVGEQRVSVPNADFVALARTGFAGETITGQGLFDAASNGDLNTLEAEINAYKTDPELMGGHPFTEDASAGGRSRRSVALKEYAPTGQRSLAANGRIVVRFRIAWEVLIP